MFLAGQGPLAAGTPTVTSKIGSDLTEQDGCKAARATILVSLATLRAEIGSLDRTRQALTTNSPREKRECAALECVMATAKASVSYPHVTKTPGVCGGKA